jgi:indole-3-glycerol phosphate synthase
MASELGAELIGINNRDLHTFKTDIATTSELLRGYTGSALIVSESGIETPGHIQQLSEAGASGFLIGESLLRGGKPREALSALLTQRQPASA